MSISFSGIEQSLHEDISTHMCSSVPKSITNIIVICICEILLRDPNLNDLEVCEIMVVSYIMSYMILFTVMEPLRSGIKAVYICFAQHPQSLAQAFPLVYQRLKRMADDTSN